MKVVCIASVKCTDDCVTGEQGQLYQLYHVHPVFTIQWFRLKV